jgi:hypothetical protein
VSNHHYRCAACRRPHTHSIPDPRLQYAAQVLHECGPRQEFPDRRLTVHFCLGFHIHHHPRKCWNSLHICACLYQRSPATRKLCSVAFSRCFSQRFVYDEGQVLERRRLAMSYTFGYLSHSGSLLVVGRNSVATSSVSVLPEGTDSEVTPMP